MQDEFCVLVLVAVAGGSDVAVREPDRFSISLFRAVLKVLVGPPHEKSDPDGNRPFLDHFEAGLIALVSRHDGTDKSVPPFQGSL